MRALRANVERVTLRDYGSGPDEGDIETGVSVIAGVRLTVHPDVPGFGLHDLQLALLAGSLVIILSVVAVRWTARSGLPSLLVYLGIGLVLGEAVIGIDWENTALTMVLGYAALVLILIEGGLTTSWEHIRSSVGPAGALSTLGVVVSVLVVAGAVDFAFGLPWQQSMIVGAILSSTDAAAVFSVLRKVPLPRPVSGILEAESGFNDAPVVIIVTTLAVSAGTSEVTPWWMLAGTALWMLAGGVVVGLVTGWVGGKLLSRLAVGSSTLFAIGVIAVAVLAYALADAATVSGFMACYCAALLLGNIGLPHRGSIGGFATALGWLAQIGLFVLLGLLADPTGFASQLVPALIIGSVLLLLARPLSVIVSCTPFRVPWRTQAFLSWAGLRGAVPVVLATVPLTFGTPGLSWIFDLVFVLVVVFTIIQAPTLPWVAARLGLAEPHHELDIAVEAEPIEELGAEMLQVTVGPTSRMVGVTIAELRLPRKANVSLVVRGDVSIVPRESTVIRQGDHLLIITPMQARAALTQRLQGVSQYGRLAEWNKGRRAPEHGQG